MTPAAAMVFAAGFGTRMGSLTADRPKPLLPVGGTPLLDHTLDLVTGAGIGRAVVNLHYRGEMIRAHLDGRKAPEVVFSQEQPDILDTGGGVVQALHMLGEAPFATINADTVFLGVNPLSELSGAWPASEDDVDALMLLVPVELTVAYSRAGDFFVENGRPRRRRTEDRAPYVYAGAQLIRPSAFAEPPGRVFSLNVVWDRLLDAGRLGSVIYPGRWVDVGTPEGLEAADRLLVAGG